MFGGFFFGQSFFGQVQNVGAPVPPVPPPEPVVIRTGALGSGGTRRKFVQTYPKPRPFSIRDIQESLVQRQREAAQRQRSIDERDQADISTILAFLDRL